jgi:hypothetical protein
MRLCTLAFAGMRHNSHCRKSAQKESQLKLLVPSSDIASKIPLATIIKIRSGKVFVHEHPKLFFYQGIILLHFHFLSHVTFNFLCQLEYREYSHHAMHLKLLKMNYEIRFRQTLQMQASYLIWKNDLIFF